MIDMIDNFLGIGGGGGHSTLWLLPYNVKGQVKSPILRSTWDGSEFYIPYLSHYM